MKEYLAGSTLLFASFTLAGQTDVYLNELQLKFTENSELCLDEHKWPQFSSSQSEPWMISRLNALASVGFIRATIKSSGVEYQLTEKGQEAWLPHEDFCYGALRISKIKAIEPQSDGISTVYFYYGVTGMPDWARDKNIRHAYSEVDTILRGMNKEVIQVDVRENPDGTLELLNYPTPASIDEESE
ncbi:hypothetical protein F9883_12870 [Morganella morganii]|uniref:hypothetical protein n=1 Tax=Morganella morganii TaxID=582 RepID=UPI0015F63E38|nr:hypothetical protein [Morganella morganii]MBA5808768.1 hypothetical protein [Morganella morganii]